MAERNIVNWWQRFRRSNAHTQANIVCTAIVAAATVGYSFTAYRQLGAMRDTLGAMKQSNNASEKFFDIQNRPWIVFTPGDIHTDLASGQITYEGSLENIGSTPAPSAWSRVHSDSSRSIPAQFTFDRSDPITPQSYASKGSVKYIRSATIFPAPFPLGPIGTIYGWVVYRDVFDGTRFHLTEFGAFVRGGILELSEPVPAGGIKHPVHIVTSWNQVPELACFDEGCKDYQERVDEVLEFERTSNRTAR